MAKIAIKNNGAKTSKKRTRTTRKKVGDDATQVLAQNESQVESSENIDAGNKENATVSEAIPAEGSQKESASNGKKNNKWPY